MLDENKLKNLHQFLTSKHSYSSKKVSLNKKSETTSPSSYNERNYSAQNKPLEGNNKNKMMPYYLGYNKSNTIERNCYNNINLLENLKHDENINNDSLSGDLNKNDFGNINIINVSSVSKNENRLMYNKTLFSQIMKYYVRKSKNSIIKSEEIDFMFKPMTKLINNQKRSMLNIKNIKKEMEEKSSLKIDKKDISKKNRSTIDSKSNGLNDGMQIKNNKNDLTSNDNKNYIGIDENFNLTFGKSSNKIEIKTTSSTNYPKANYKNIKSKNYKNNKYVKNNLKFNINNFKNNISTLKNKKMLNNIEINLQSQRNSEQPLVITENYFKEEMKIKKVIDKNINKEESTPSFAKKSNKSNKDEEKTNSKASFQIKNRKINLPKNSINIDNIKFNNHIFQSLLNHKNNYLKNSKKKLDKKNNNENDLKQ